jgi:hypothetical protein
LKACTESTDWKFNIQFEFTARDTPQQNYLAELGFATLANRGLWKEAFKTATLLDGLTATTIGGVTDTRYVHWGGANPSFAKHLKTWGEAGTVKIKIKVTPRVADRGVQCMMVGYAPHHDGDCYMMWDPHTQRIHESRDITSG